MAFTPSCCSQRSEAVSKPRTCCISGCSKSKPGLKDIATAFHEMPAAAAADASIACSVTPSERCSHSHSSSPSNTNACVLFGKNGLTMPFILLRCCSCRTDVRALRSFCSLASE
eukprot:1892777-Prymnesium_polylepis.1